MAMRVGKWSASGRWLWIAAEAFAALLNGTTSVDAAPLAGFFAALLGGALGTLPLDIGLGTGLTGLAALGGSIGAFIGANWLTIAVIGASIAISAFQQKSPTASVFNVKVEVGPRRHAFGLNKVGAQALFGAFAANGAFWYLLAHCDEELVGDVVEYRLDDIPVVLGVDHRVTTADFKTESGGFLGVGKGLNPFFSIWTQTFSDADPVPPPLAAFKTAFPEWTDDHKLAGVTYSIVKIDSVDKDARPGVYKWQQGPFHLGEPGLTITAWFGRALDPRDEDQDQADPSTWLPTRNLALAFGWNRVRPFGFGMSVDEVNWDLVGAAADICDEAVLDKNGVSWPRYAGGLAFDESMNNIQIEQMILAACDGMVLYDEAGRVYLKVGKYEAPTVTLSAARDIMGMDSQIVEDGEAQLDGVVVVYTEPDYGYIEQPSAPWYNPRYHDGARIPNLQQVSIPAIQSHNQAVRIAKAIGEMTQPAYKLAPTIGLRALLCRRQRIIGVDYDADFTGAHQIAAPVMFDISSGSGTLAIVPVTANTWDLLPGEEGNRPRRDTVTTGLTIPDAVNVTVVSVPIAGSNGNAVQLQASFDAPVSSTFRYEFEYSSNGGTTWQSFDLVDMAALKAQVTLINSGVVYDVRWRTATSGGKYGDYSAPVAVYAFAHLTADMTVVRADTTIFTADAS
jgi:hypothetical protein